MKLIFFGTPDYVVGIIDRLNRDSRQNKHFSVAGVVTQQPKTTGRNKILTYSPVDHWAHKRKIPKFYSPTQLVDSGIGGDVAVLASYGEIIPPSVLSRFRYGILNLHPSLLPKYRGASPVQAAICAGDSLTGLSIIKLDDKLDHGPIVSQFKEDILPTDTTGLLRQRLFERGAEVLSALLPQYLNGKVSLHPQDDSRAGFTRQLTKDDGFIPPEYLSSIFNGKTSKGDWKLAFIRDFSISKPRPVDMERFIRAMDPWPQAWTLIKLQRSKDDKPVRLKILKAHLENRDKNAGLVIDTVQLEGKNPTSLKQFCEGYPNNSFR